MSEGGNVNRAMRGQAKKAHAGLVKHCNTAQRQDRKHTDGLHMHPVLILEEPIPPDKATVYMTPITKW